MAYILYILTHRVAVCTLSNPKQTSFLHLPTPTNRDLRNTHQPGDLVSTSQPKRLKKSTEERRSCRWDRTLQIVVSFDLVPRCPSNKDPILLMWQVVKPFLKVLPEVPGMQRGNACFYPEGLMWAQNAEHKMRTFCACRVEVHRSWVVLSHWDHISPVHLSHPLESLEASRIHDCARPSWKWWQT